MSNTCCLYEKSPSSYSCCTVHSEASDHYRLTCVGMNRICWTSNSDVMKENRSAHTFNIGRLLWNWKSVYWSMYVLCARHHSPCTLIDALTELVTWFHALDHTNYARWIPIHLKDMAELPTKHPEVSKEFSNGNFTIRKTNRVFSSIPIDPAHEQNNAYIKGGGGAVGLTDNPSALRRWMVARPEVSRVIKEFHDQHHQWGSKMNTLHHDQTPSIQAAFAKDVRSLVSTFKDLGNPFEEESTDLLVLDTKEITDHASVEAVQNV